MAFRNAIIWFEIPVTNLERAQKFYEIIFAINMIPADFPKIRMRMFPVQDLNGVGGALCDSGGFHVLLLPMVRFIYLNGIPMYKTFLIKWKLMAERSLYPNRNIFRLRTHGGDDGYRR